MFFNVFIGVNLCAAAHYGVNFSRFVEVSKLHSNGLLESEQKAQRPLVFYNDDNDFCAHKTSSKVIDTNELFYQNLDEITAKYPFITKKEEKIKIGKWRTEVTPMTIYVEYFKRFFEKRGMILGSSNNADVYCFALNTGRIDDDGKEVSVLMVAAKIAAGVSGNIHFVDESLAYAVYCYKDGFKAADSVYEVYNFTGMVVKYSKVAYDADGRFSIQEQKILPTVSDFMVEKLICEFIKNTFVNHFEAKNVKNVAGLSGDIGFEPWSTVRLEFEEVYKKVTNALFSGVGTIKILQYTVTDTKKEGDNVFNLEGFEIDLDDMIEWMRKIVMEKVGVEDISDNTLVRYLKLVEEISEIPEESGSVLLMSRFMCPKLALFYNATRTRYLGFQVGKGAVYISSNLSLYEKIVEKELESKYKNSHASLMKEFEIRKTLKELKTGDNFEKLCKGFTNVGDNIVKSFIKQFKGLKFNKGFWCKNPIKDLNAFESGRRNCLKLQSVNSKEQEEKKKITKSINDLAVIFKERIGRLEKGLDTIESVYKNKELAKEYDAIILEGYKNSLKKKEDFYETNSNASVKQLSDLLNELNKDLGILEIKKTRFFNKIDEIEKKNALEAQKKNEGLKDSVDEGEKVEEKTGDVPDVKTSKEKNEELLEDLKNKFEKFMSEKKKEKNGEVSENKEVNNNEEGNAFNFENEGMNEEKNNENSRDDSTPVKEL